MRFNVEAKGPSSPTELVQINGAIAAANVSMSFQSLHCEGASSAVFISVSPRQHTPRTVQRMSTSQPLMCLVSPDGTRSHLVAKPATLQEARLVYCNAFGLAMLPVVKLYIRINGRNVELSDDTAWIAAVTHFTEVFADADAALADKTMSVKGGAPLFAR